MNLDCGTESIHELNVVRKRVGYSINYTRGQMTGSPKVVAYYAIGNCPWRRPTMGCASGSGASSSTA